MSEIDVSSLSVVAIEAFFDRELEAMSSVRRAYTALDDAVVKKIQLRGFAARAQYNPHRAQSSSARVDAASIKARRCFLCKANRPAGQTMLDLGTYELLVNPFPVFKRHFTIPDRRHVPQSISGRITHMGVLAQAMTGYTVFYNGPRCGASAPDHMHFQAGLSDAFSLPDVARGSALSSYAGGKCRIFAFGESPVPLFLIRSTELSALEDAFAEVYSAVKSVAGCAGEPMMNILCRAVGGVVDLYVIP
ncbi:MAG: DUF4922 domain-containing protein, partial [Muribaculaceae bacterium]|nr:DUF4922 domain-containing protein [Muribaculaceae bacterium]